MVSVPHRLARGAAARREWRSLRSAQGVGEVIGEVNDSEGQRGAHAQE